ncbi:hypothetical protein NPIL_618801 [Nephila pilipes]|uniref:Uncharacterized protein n=1 Tax=Nephila pilipes TaxID=299642 RepID=A0A8X6PKP6_NEPPI|nr:hypothetical protein NPIL_618801 [Nephila pilipes]
MFSIWGHQQTGTEAQCGWAIVLISLAWAGAMMRSAAVSNPFPPQRSGRSSLGRLNLCPRLAPVSFLLRDKYILIHRRITDSGSVADVLKRLTAWDATPTFTIYTAHFQPNNNNVLPFISDEARFSSNGYMGWLVRASSYLREPRVLSCIQQNRDHDRRSTTQSIITKICYQPYRRLYLLYSPLEESCIGLSSLSSSGQTVPDPQGSCKKVINYVNVHQKVRCGMQPPKEFPVHMQLIWAVQQQMGYMIWPG